MTTTYAEVTDHDRIIYSDRMMPIGARPQINPNLANPERTVASAPTIPTEIPDSGWDMTNVSKLATNEELAITLTNPTAFTFMDSGNKLLVYDSFDSSINCYNLSSPYILTGAIFESQCAVVGDVVEMWIDETGVYAFLLRNTSSIGSVNVYKMSIAFDISTIAFHSRISIGEGYWKGMYVSTNGHHLYVGSTKGYLKHIYMYFPLDLGWTDTIETIKISGVSSIDGVVINPAGTRLYVADANSALLKQYTLNTPYYVTDHVYDDFSFDLNGIGVVSLFIEDEQYADVFGVTEDKIIKYKISLTFLSSNITTWVYTGINDATYASGNTTDVYSMLMRDDIGKFYAGMSNGTVKEFSITGQDISTISLLNTTSSFGGSVFQMGWYNNGTKFYVMRYVYQGESWREYDASIPYDTSSLTYTGRFITFAYNYGGWFNSDGTKLILLRKDFGSNRTYMRFYTLPTPWELSGYTLDGEQQLHNDNTMSRPIPNPDSTQVYFYWEAGSSGMRVATFSDPFVYNASFSFPTTTFYPGHQMWAHALTSDGKYYYEFNVSGHDIRQWQTDCVAQ